MSQGSRVYARRLSWFGLWCALDLRCRLRQMLRRGWWVMVTIFRLRLGNRRRLPELRLMTGLVILGRIPRRFRRRVLGLGRDICL